MLINVEILVLSCTLRLSEFCVILQSSQGLWHMWNTSKLQKNVRWKAFTTANFELHNCFAWVSNFQLQSNIVMAMGYQLLTINHFKAC